ncbi:L-lactate dehydrogenase complex protein LldF [Malonomonas rubra DSM 5091]|uniref:L-lactate dehydrogenase complex protein LldF n=1 Tax=Malonomonas rubra DSM 5091 TaxID=1122189 RepID=A0A1M6JZX6_MALRU|nr:LutB/LldF family L-lactate oxidation iron-sulfur protein [Malonomonas rubra]SHJ52194.1 L-lactate dehydrogenase complex protein LldF [Malonomonas rubra DSM 5091]
MKPTATRHNFRAASSSAIQNKRVQKAVRNTAGLLARMRATTVNTKPEFEELRNWGRNRKLLVSENLEKWVAQFKAQVEQQGGVVHRAKDAAEAGRIISEIARERGITAAVKSKSMTSEEVGLNDILQDAGITVTETDLGEFIVQLAGEHPSHILAPAIHRNQDDVRKLFTEKLGAPADLDVEGLVRFARKVLRHKFLEAGMGITGGNFAVADTGTVAIVTNEGNGRMCTTVPPVHVALVGIEKLIPSIKDLPDFLSLLTCSATGQRASSYISMTTGPRRTNETEGPEEFHVVLLDNGRSSIAASPWREMLHCLHCGSCLNHCPVYHAVGGHAYESSYPGPMGSVLSTLLWGKQSYPELANACTLCGRCVDVCAVKIPLANYHRTLRHQGGSNSQTSYLAARLASHPGAYRRGIHALRRMLRTQPLTKVLPKINKSVANWQSCRVLPVAGEEQPFRDWWHQHQPKGQAPKLKRVETKEVPSVPEDKKAGTADREELLALYRQRAGALGVEIVETSVAELSGLIGNLLKDESVSSVALPRAGWPQKLDERVAEILAGADCQTVSCEDETGWNMAALANAQLGITYSSAFLAETGSLIYPAGAGNGTLASLLPEVHLAISASSTLLSDLNAYFKNEAGPLPSRLTQIAGPSRTGDIEGTMTVGVHGPRRVIHWILSDLDTGQ